jgi:hypothetical protein
MTGVGLRGAGRDTGADCKPARRRRDTGADCKPARRRRDTGADCMPALTSRAPSVEPWIALIHQTFLEQLARDQFIAVSRFPTSQP